MSKEGTVLATDDELQKVLNHQISNDALGDVTVREYLHKVMSTLWAQGDNFNPKKPFNNSYWRLELLTNLVKGGFIPGTIQSPFLDEPEWEEVEFDYGFDSFSYVQSLIKVAFFGASEAKEISESIIQ